MRTVSCSTEDPGWFALNPKKKKTKTKKSPRAVRAPNPPKRAALVAGSASLPAGPCAAPGLRAGPGPPGGFDASELLAQVETHLAVGQKSVPKWKPGKQKHGPKPAVA